MYKICIITPGTIASNPRVVKEAEALSGAGYKVHLIYTRHVPYLIDTDQEILESHPTWTYDFLDWAGKGLIPRFIKLISGLKRRAASLLLAKDLYTHSNMPFLSNRFYLWQLKKAIDSNADLYIAHYPESISVAANAAKINKALFAFDAEDYHRGENLPAVVIKMISLNEDTFLPKANYITAASALIAEAYQGLYPSIPVVPVENMFPVKNQPVFKNLDSNVFKFFWFSQTIGPQRGLEEFIRILGGCSDGQVQLTLLGNVAAEYKASLTDLWTRVGLELKELNFLTTVPEAEIFKIAAEHHFGLCLEIPSVPNKDFCMSNKLYSYILSGNFLILSHTRAQLNFHKQYPLTSITIDINDTEGAAIEIRKIINDPEPLNRMRQKNYELGNHTLNFDREKAILLKQVAAVWS